MAPTRGKNRSSSVAQHNASGFAKRRANSKKSVPTSLDDVYEYTTSKNKRAAVKLTHDRAELVGLDHNDEDNEMSGVNMQAIRSRILNLGDVDDVVNSDEDEEINSDVAFEESDAEEYAGFSFPGPKKPSKVKRQRKSQVKFADEINMEENEMNSERGEEDESEGENEEEDQSGEEDEYLDVLDVLDGRGEPYFGEESGDENVAKESRQSEHDMKGQLNGAGEERKEGEEEEEESSESDADGDESNEDPFLPSEDDNEDNIDHLDSFIANLDTTTRKRKVDDDRPEPPEAQEPRKKRFLQARTEAGAENEFNVPMATAPRLELEDLLAPIESSSALQSLKQSIKPLINGTSLSIPLPLRAQEKIDRAAAYEQTKGEIDKWNETMKQIKKAEHLSFPLQAPQPLTSSNAGLAAKFKPSTEMESAVDKLLRAANLRNDSDIVKTEELKLNHLSVEEVAQRRAELRKMRDLMFRAEIKAKRIAKIKSKTYRKIHKKAREKLKNMTQDADGDVIDEKEERLKHETERAKERATLRHKNTGKWAKAMQARGEMDIDQRGEIEEMLVRGEQLRRKIQADGGSNDEDEDEDGDGTSDVEAIKARAFEELEHLDKEDGNPLPQKSKGVFAMKFMQNAMARSAAEVNASADQFREEMERLGEADGASDEDDGGRDDVAHPENVVQVNRSNGRLVFQPGQTMIPSLHMAPSETASTLKSSVDPALSPAVASQLTMRSSPPIPNEDIPLIELSPPPPDHRPPIAEPNPWLQPQGKVAKTITKHEVVIGKHSDQQRKMKHQMQKQLNKSVESRAEAMNDAQVDVNLGDVLVLPTESAATAKEVTSNDSKRPKNKTQNGKSKDKSGSENHVDAAYEDSDEDSEVAFQEDHLLPNGKENPKAFKQKDLVAMAFAGDNVVEDFDKLKKREVEGDAPHDEDNTLPGWGSWGGRGVKVDPKAKKVIKKVPGIDPTTRADRGKPRVIISEKKDKKAAKYLVKDLPYPYTSNAQFEKVMNTPVGTEWNPRDTFQKQTLPRVLKKMGTVINPLEKLF